MAWTGYVDLRGHPTWVHRSDGGERRGERGGERTLVLLHGGLSCSEDLLGPLEPELAASYRVVAFDRRGHGYTADTDEPFHYESMADEVIALIEWLGAPAHLVGWSDGGIAALLASRRRPDLVARQVLIGANFHRDGVIGLDSLEEDTAASGALAQAYGARSPDGAEHFAQVHAKFLAMARTEPTLAAADLATVTTPTLVLAGDDDLVRLDHTVALYEGLPNGQLAIVPGSSHAVPLEKPGLVTRLVTDFLSGTVPPETMLPVRRAQNW